MLQRTSFHGHRGASLGTGRTATLARNSAAVRGTRSRPEGHPPSLRGKPPMGAPDRRGHPTSRFAAHRCASGDGSGARRRPGSEAVPSVRRKPVGTLLQPSPLPCRHDGIQPPKDDALEGSSGEDTARHLDDGTRRHPDREARTPGPPDLRRLPRGTGDRPGRAPVGDAAALGRIARCLSVPAGRAWPQRHGGASSLPRTPRPELRTGRDQPRATGDLDPGAGRIPHAPPGGLGWRALGWSRRPPPRDAAPDRRGTERPIPLGPLVPFERRGASRSAGAGRLHRRRGVGGRGLVPPVGGHGPRPAKLRQAST